MISVGTSSTICPAPRLLDLVHRYRVTALVSSPQLAAELAALERAAGRRPAASSLDVLVAVQPAAPERLDRIGATWGASVTSLFGTATMPATAVPCGAGRLHLLDQRLEASVDAPTPGRIAAGSLRGELLLAGCHPSVSRTTPAPTGELVELSPPGEPCPCGSTAPVLLPLGRTGDALPTSCGPLTRLDVEHCLYEHPSVSGRLTVHARQGRLCVECEVVEDSPDLESQLRGHLEERLGVDVDLSLLADGSTGVHARTERGDALNSTYDRSVRRTG